MKTLLVLIVALFTLILTPNGAFAHGIGGASGSNSTSKVIKITPKTTYFSAISTKNGQEIKITKTSKHTLSILGIESEPYIKISNDGVFVNTKSGTYLINQSTNTNINQAELNSQFEKNNNKAAEPKYQKVSNQQSYTFHDHRIHYMGSVPEKGAHLGTNVLPIRVGNEIFKVKVSFSTIDKPNYLIYLIPLIIIIILLFFAAKYEPFMLAISKTFLISSIMMILFILELIHIIGYMKFVNKPILNSATESLYGMILLLLIIFTFLRIYLNKTKAKLLYKISPLLLTIGLFGLIVDTFGEYSFFTYRYLPTLLPITYSRISLILIGILSSILFILGFKNLGEKADSITA